MPVELTFHSDARQIVGKCLGLGPNQQLVVLVNEITMPESSTKEEQTYG